MSEWTDGGGKHKTSVSVSQTANSDRASSFKETKSINKTEQAISARPTVFLVFLTHEVENNSRYNDRI
jgi:hypothetical protein